MKKNERLLAAALDAAAEAIVGFDRKGRILFWNRGAEQLLGYLPEEVLGREVGFLLPPEGEGEGVPAGSGGGAGPPAEFTDRPGVRLARGGRRIALRLSRRAVRDEGGRLLGAVETLRPAAGGGRVETAAGRADEAQRYLDIAGVIIVALNREGEVTLINRKGCRVLGCEEGEVVGRNWFDAFLPPAVREETRRVFNVLMAGGVELAESHENPVLTKSGEERLVAWHNSLLTDAEGRVVGTLSSGEDITERRRAGEEARRSQEFFRSVADENADPVIITNADRQIVFWNRGAERLYGYAEEEALGRDVVFLVPPEDRAEWIRTMEPALAKILQTGKPFQFEGLRLAKEGRRVPVSVTFSPVRGPGGEVVAISGLTKDLTEVKRAERELREGETRLRTALDSMVDGLITIDVNGTIESFNQAAERLFGYAAEEVVGRNVSVLMPEPYRGEHDRYIRSYLETGKAKIIGFGREVEGRRKDGTVFPLSLAVSEMRLGERRMFVGNIRDITEERRLREQLHQSEKLSAIGELAAGIAHEIGGPLSVISGNAEFLKERLEAGDPRREDVEAIVRECDAVAALVRRLLDFSRPARLEMRPVEVNEILRNLLLLVRKQISRGNIEIKLDLQVGLPPIWGDPNQLEQVFMNLVLNAWHAMPEGGELRIRSYTPGADGGGGGGFVAVNFADTGVGVREEDLGRIFEPYFTTRARGQGTGLGLAVSRRIVTDHRGTISVRSRPGEGATFTIELPASAGEGR